MLNIPGGADINVGTDRFATGGYLPGDYSPNPDLIGLFADPVRVGRLLRALPAVQLRSLAAMALEEADARGD